jgi:hypothetical protein
MKISQFDPRDYDYFPPDGEQLNGDARDKPPKFPLIAWNNIEFNPNEEWRVDKVLPRIGLAAFYGGPGTVKTFVLIDLFRRIACGGLWGGRDVEPGPVVYIAAEGGGGIKKRIKGLKKFIAEQNLPANIPFYLITVAPNFGTGEDDRVELIQCIEALGIQPAAIGIDTAAQSLGGADENGQGMAQLVINGTALFNYFKCLVVFVHHVPLSDDKRLRGGTNLIGALDVSILLEREKGSMTASLTVMKLKDEDDFQKFTVHLTRIVVCSDKKGREVSTLVVESVEPGAIEGSKAPQPKSIPRGQRLLIAVVSQALSEDETVKTIRPYADGPLIKAVPDDAVRRRYYARLAEKARPGEPPQKLADRQRQAFYTAVKEALNATILIACEQDETRFLWLP